MLAATFGILLGFPVLRLRGDYLAIVTLGFGEIIRLILENWGEFSQGPSGISNISRPGFFGMEFSLEQSILYTYYLMILLVIVTIFVVNRLQDSRLGRAWIALREDEIACQAMGIDKRKTKLVAFSLGAFWAGIVGVMFAAKTTFVNPASFTFLESAIILSIVVLGGMGSIIGVVLRCPHSYPHARIFTSLIGIPNAGFRCDSRMYDDFQTSGADFQYSPHI